MSAVEKPKTTPVLTTEELDKAEKLKKKELYEKLRLRMGTSKLSVQGPAGFTPYWARKEDDTEMARLDYLGFRVVRELEGQPKRYKAQGSRADGTYTMGDVILMEIPTEEYDFYRGENSRRAAEMASSAKAKFVEDAEKQGAPTFQVKRKA